MKVVCHPRQDRLSYKSESTDVEVARDLERPETQAV
jgi:hypothetical protein